MFMSHIINLSTNKAERIKSLGEIKRQYVNGKRLQCRVNSIWLSLENETV